MPKIVLHLLLLTLIGISASVDEVSNAENDVHEANYQTYEGDVVLEIKLDDADQWHSIFQNMSKLRPNHTLDVWKATKFDKTVHVMVPVKDQEDFRTVLLKNRVKAQMMVSDLGRKTRQLMMDPKRCSSSSSGMSWTAYHRLATIYSWMDAMAEAHNDIAKTVTIGKSFEGRPLKVLKINTNKKRNNIKKRVLVDAGIHAREWIGPAAVTYVMNEFLKHPSKYRELVDSFEWHFLPVLNPDGYEYTHTTKRFWRKTRSIRASTGSCYGVDANRNFKTHWGEREEGKASPCAEIYPGPTPESEKCTQAFVRYTKRLNSDKNLVASFSTHSFSQVWLIPYGFSKEKPANYENMLEVANAGADEIKSTTGTVYQVGTPPDLMYVATGLSQDWVHDGAGVPYSYTIELASKGDGFSSPPQNIKSIGKELLAGLRGAMRAIKKKLILE